MFKKALIIGAARGLGKSVAEFLPHHFEGAEITLTSRQFEAVNLNRLRLDLSRDDDQIKLVNQIKEQAYDLVVYAAGGGPHGEYSQKEWKDHKWALSVGLEAPMRLAHAWLDARKQNDEGRFVIVGSRIAENSPDPLASSYAAAKHGLVGFVSSLQEELELNKNKVWLFSPGYMDTDMLPKTARVRHDGSKLMSADTAAQAMLRWIKNPESAQWHRVLN